MMLQLTERQIEQLKRNAKRHKKQLGLTHAQCLDKVAKELGYDHWAHLMKHNPLQVSA